MPASWDTCAEEPRAPESVIMRIGLNLSRLGRILIAQLVGGVVPDINNAGIALVLAQQTAAEQVVDLANLLARPPASMVFLQSGTLMSATDTVIAPTVEYLKPSALMLSSTCAVRCSP